MVPASLRLVVLAPAILAIAPLPCVVVADRSRPAEARRPAASSATPTPGPRATPVTGTAGGAVKSGLAWLVAHQLPNGAWGQGEESQTMGSGGALRDVASVADTGLAALALARAGSTPKSGPHAEAIRRAALFTCTEVEKAPEDGLAVTSLTGTRIQAKLGGHVDTFVAGLFLAEIKGHMPNAAENSRVEKALTKVMAKIQGYQRPDGTFTTDGWAPTLSQGMASAALGKAAMAGVVIDEDVRRRAEEHAARQQVAGGFRTDGAAGVELYAAASSIQSMAENDRANRKQEKELRDRVASPSAPAGEKAKAAARLESMETNRQQLGMARASAAAKMSDASFVAGFGSNGGEEFLSYLAIGESLHQDGGEEWTAWKTSMAANLERVQNADGSWTGHHCITGRTTCTSAALMVLTLDRATTSVTGRIRG